MAKKLKCTKRSLGATLFWLGIASGMLFVLMNTRLSRGQASAAPATSRSSFDIVSIRPDRSDGNHTRVSFDSDSLLATGVTLKRLIEVGYNVNDSQLSGGPDWAHSARYEVHAKIMDETAVEAFKSLPAEQKLEQRQLMVQSLLADRFKLKLSRASKELPVYALKLAQKGPVISPSSSASSGISNHAGDVRFTGFSMSAFTDWLSDLVGRKVIDQTGLQGKYDFALRWGQERQTLSPDSIQGPDSLSSDSSGPSIFTALQEQMGVKLESARGPVQILVIESAEKPTED
jgi:uncharacterized protein (TIGR03435 family)